MRTLVVGVGLVGLLGLAGCGGGRGAEELRIARDSIAALSRQVDSLQVRMDSIATWQRAAIESMIQTNELEAARCASEAFGKSFPDSTQLIVSFFDRVAKQAMDQSHAKQAEAKKQADSKQASKAPRSRGSRMVECWACGGSGHRTKMMDQPLQDCQFCGGRGWKFEDE